MPMNMAKILLAVIVFAVCTATACEASEATGTDRRGGFPAANFSIGASFQPGGGIPERITYNPPVLGKWLEDVSDGYFTFDYGAGSNRLGKFRWDSIARWPTA